jgi:hypothetical protein
LSSLSASPAFIDRNVISWSVNNPTSNPWTWTLSSGGTTLATIKTPANTAETSIQTTNHNSLSQNTTYSYSLTAIRDSTGVAPTAAGYAPRSASAKTFAFGTSSISATNPTSSSIRVSGTINNNASSAQWEWRIRRLKSDGTNDTVVKAYATINAGSSANFDITNTGLSSSTTYIYYLEARNASTNNSVQYFPSVGWIAALNTTSAAVPAPVFSSTPSSQILRLGENYDIYVAASNTATYSITNVGVGVPIFTTPPSFGGVPTGMSITTYGSGSYAYISGTPTTIGDYYFRVRANGTGGSVTDTTQIIFYVRHPVPSFTDTSVSTNWVVNKNYSLAADRTVAASNVSSYSIVNPGTGTFASWLSINSSGQLSGTPTTTGTYSFRVRATGAGDDSVDTATINIVVHGAVSWIDQTLADGIKGVPYSDRVEAQNATAYAISPAFNLSATGLSFNPLSGLIAGTPKEITSYTFTITASNPGDSISKQFTISFKSGGRRMQDGVAVTIENKKRWDTSLNPAQWVDITTARRFNSGTNQWEEISN